GDVDHRAAQLGRVVERGAGQQDHVRPRFLEVVRVLGELEVVALGNHPDSRADIVALNGVVAEMHHRDFRNVLLDEGFDGADGEVDGVYDAEGFGFVHDSVLYLKLSDFSAHRDFNRLHHADTQQNDAKCNHVQCADNAEDDAIAEAVVEQIAHYQAEHHAPHGPAEAHQAGHRPHGAVREDIGRQNHDQGGPGLLPGKRDAEQHDGNLDRRLRDEKDQWHHRRAGAQGELSREVQRAAALNEPAGKPAAEQAAHAGRRVRNPGEIADLFGVEVAHVVQVLGQPEEVEIPGCVAQELGAHQAPHLREAKQADPSHALLGLWPRL